ncbi:uncharacterized protein LOC126319874 isoform X2 [Schistocerca gregaria]|nr:uncharacterized protein LOC126319874 isoform X2 [Schistocerca gregaria]
MHDLHTLVDKWEARLFDTMNETLDEKIESLLKQQEKMSLMLERIKEYKESKHAVGMLREFGYQKETDSVAAGDAEDALRDFGEDVLTKDEEEEHEEDEVAKSYLDTWNSLRFPLKPVGVSIEEVNADLWSEFGQLLEETRKSLKRSFLLIGGIVRAYMRRGHKNDEWVAMVRRLEARVETNHFNMALDMVSDAVVATSLVPSTGYVPSNKTGLSTIWLVINDIFKYRNNISFTDVLCKQAHYLYTNFSSQIIFYLPQFVNLLLSYKNFPLTSFIMAKCRDELPFAIQVYYLTSSMSQLGSPTWQKRCLKILKQIIQQLPELYLTQPLPPGLNIKTKSKTQDEAPKKQSDKLIQRRRPVEGQSKSFTNSQIDMEYLFYNFLRRDQSHCLCNHVSYPFLPISLGSDWNFHAPPRVSVTSVFVHIYNIDCNLILTLDKIRTKLQLAFGCSWCQLLLRQSHVEQLDQGESDYDCSSSGRGYTERMKDSSFQVGDKSDEKGPPNILSRQMCLTYTNDNGVDNSDVYSNSVYNYATDGDICLCSEALVSNSFIPVAVPPLFSEKCPLFYSLNAFPKCLCKHDWEPYLKLHDSQPGSPFYSESVIKKQISSMFDFSPWLQPARLHCLPSPTWCPHYLPFQYARFTCCQPLDAYSREGSSKEAANVQLHDYWYLFSPTLQLRTWPSNSSLSVINESYLSDFLLPQLNPFCSSWINQAYDQDAFKFEACHAVRCNSCILCRYLTGWLAYIRVYANQCINEFFRTHDCDEASHLSEDPEEELSRLIRITKPAPPPKVEKSLEVPAGKEFFFIQIKFVRKIIDVSRKLGELYGQPDKYSDALNSELRQLEPYLKSGHAYLPQIDDNNSRVRVLRFVLEECQPIPTYGRVLYKMICEVLNLPGDCSNEMADEYLRLNTDFWKVSSAEGGKKREEEDGKRKTDKDEMACDEYQRKPETWKMLESSKHPDFSSQSTSSSADSDVDGQKDGSKPFVSAFGTSWKELRRRIKLSSKYAALPHWDVKAYIVKHGDFVLQELFVMQLLYQFQTIWMSENLPLHIQCYHISALSYQSGLIEVVPNSISLDKLKKMTEMNGTSLSLLEVFRYEWALSSEFKRARSNFVSSLAAYSIVCYLLQIKDRHNGNIMLDSGGHIFHIDFGYLLGRTIKFEKAPFKLTDEFVEVMGGDQSKTFKAYCNLVVRGFLAARKHYSKILLIVEMSSGESGAIPCLNSPNIATDLRKRYHLDWSEEQCEKFMMNLISEARDNWRTQIYDTYQRIVNNIH